MNIHTHKHDIMLRSNYVKLAFCFGGNYRSRVLSDHGVVREVFVTHYIRWPETPRRSLCAQETTDSLALQGIETSVQNVSSKASTSETLCKSTCRVKNSDIPRAGRKPLIGSSETQDAGCWFAVPKASDCGLLFPTSKQTHARHLVNITTITMNQINNNNNTQAVVYVPS